MTSIHSARMARVKSKGTKLERAVHSLIRSMGYHCLMNKKDLPGKPDLTFPKRRKVIFVNGCFWHGHDCRAGRNRPTSNVSYWESKLTRNAERDAEKQAALETFGWRVMVVWECEVKKNQTDLQERIRSFLEKP